MTASQPSEQGPHLVVLVHGINTWGLWMPVIEPTLQSAGFAVARTSYGHFPVPRFLLPFPPLHRTAINRVLGDIESAIQLHKPAKISAITHSFGTHVLASILRDHPEIRWHRIVFCGSVLRHDFPFNEVQDRFDYPLLNEVGTRDFWPALAESVTWGFGSAGSHGLNRPTVVSRWHDGFTHSSFLSPDSAEGTGYHF
jgi:pimeloyl-ACP methyl ester carboxylesterase